MRSIPCRSCFEIEPDLLTVTFDPQQRQDEGIEGRNHEVGPCEGPRPRHDQIHLPPGLEQDGGNDARGDCPAAREKLAAGAGREIEHPSAQLDLIDDSASTRALDAAHGS